MNSVVRELARTAEQGMARLRVRRDATGSELPLALVELDTGRAVELVLPPTFRWNGGVVDPEACAEIGAAVREDVLARGSRNQRIPNLPELTIRVRCALPSDGAWMSGRVEVATPTVEVRTRAPRPPDELRARVQIDGEEFALGPGGIHDLPFDEGQLVLRYAGAVWACPTGLLVRVGTGRPVGRPVVLPGGAVFTVETTRWLRPVVRARGEVIEVRSEAPAVASCRWRAWGDVEQEIHDGHPLCVTDGAGAALDLDVAPEGVLTLRNRGADAILGKGGVGDFRIDRGWTAQALPGDVNEVQVGRRRLGLSADGVGVRRMRESVMLVPRWMAAPLASAGARLVQVRDETFNYALVLGELLRGEGVGDWMVPALECRIDGRAAHVGCAIPVRRSMTVQIPGIETLAV